MTVVPMLAAALVVVLATVGCGGSEDASHEKPDTPGAPAAPAVSGSDVGLLLPGDQREPGAATVTTRMRLPIARTSSPARKPVPTTRPATAQTTATTRAVPPG